MRTYNRLLVPSLIRIHGRVILVKGGWMTDSTRKTTGIVGAIMVVVGTVLVTLTGGDAGTYVGVGTTAVGLISSLIAALGGSK